MSEFDYDVFSLDSYDYILDPSRIAQSPLKNRDDSKLLYMNRLTGDLKDVEHFFKIIDLLKPGDVLVRNNSKVIPARLIGYKEKTKGQVELLLLNQIKGKDDTWLCLTKNCQNMKIDDRVMFSNDNLLVAECKKIHKDGIKEFHFSYDGIFMEILEKLGKMPLPPYIHSQLLDNSRYQTIYAKIDGSAAAPTAGFHFTQSLFDELKKKGVIILDVTLHVGLSTFKPVKENDIRDHDMHSEYYYVSSECASELNKAKEEKRRIIAIGTTSTRTLESVVDNNFRFNPTSGETKLFIYPGYKFKAIDGLITNFHLPKSTLLMLVSAFSTRENILNAYKHALDNDYRFFSFGDAMFIV